MKYYIVRGDNKADYADYNALKITTTYTMKIVEDRTIGIIYYLIIKFPLLTLLSGLLIPFIYDNSYLKRFGSSVLLVWSLFVVVIFIHRILRFVRHEHYGQKVFFVTRDEEQAYRKLQLLTK